MRITEWNTEEAMAVWREEGIEEGIEVGLAQGLERGIAQTNQKFVRNLLAKGMSIEEIALLAELPVAQVRAIKKSKAK
ncbi:MAG: hypothetical protein LBC99_09315 [Spirochaetota bacterium]|jgi:predicted transposase/invertase (TIGR01784 family)|nr:hypothetical protein [Spirochaetota bacterium]